jgi:hypothetical protein
VAGSPKRRARKAGQSVPAREECRPPTVDTIESRAAARARAREAIVAQANDLLQEELPSPQKIAIEAMLVLRDVALHGGQDGGARVMAARTLLDRVAPEGRIEAPEPTPEWTPAQQADFEARHIDPEPEGDARQ